MDNLVGLLDQVERRVGIKTAHNELRIVALLFRAGELRSQEIMRQTGRSLSGHNADLRRLAECGVIACRSGASDRRERIYFLTAAVREELLALLDRALPA